MKIFDMLKNGSKYERAEGYCIVVLLIGAIMLSAGIGLNVIGTKGISAVFAMLGSFIAFLATIALILTWLVQELFGE